VTPKKASRVNGCEIVALESGVYAAVEDGVVRARTRTRNLKRAVFLLVEEVYRQNRMKALERDGFQCVNCGSAMWLQIHHVVHRGMAATNRDDRVDNLRTYCRSCHEREHGGN